MKRLMAMLLAIVVMVGCMPLGSFAREAGNSSSGTAGKTAVDPAIARENQIRKIMADMTLEDKVYQLFIVMPYALAGTSAGSNYYTVESGLKNNIKKYPVGGIILNDKNIQSESQLIKLNQDLQAASKLPLIITCDEEGGTVSRLKPILDASDVLDSMYTYKDRGTDVAKANAKKIADYMTKYGFNADFAPVADVWSNPDNKVIGERAYSDDFKEAASLVGAAVTGFKEGKIACTLKHFPGHGDTTADSHAGVVYVTKTVEQIRAEEFLPFKAGIDAGAEMVMIGHLNVNAVDANTPALFSSTIVTEWLRDELGFKGVVVTDALEMRALDGYTDSEVAINAIAAGVDMLLMPGNLENYANALINAAKANASASPAGIKSGDAVNAADNSSKITEARIDESVYRILNMKAELGLLGDPEDPGDTEGFTVQYYANIQRLDQTGAADNELPVIDTSGKNLPLNGHYTDTNNNVINHGGPVNFRNIFLKSVGTNKYKVATHNELTMVYKTREFVYDDAPGLEYVDILQNNTNYRLKEIWVLKAGKSADSVDSADWDVYTDVENIRFTNTQASAGGNVIFIDDSTVIRLVYDPSSARLSNAVDMWDIDGTDGKWYKDHSKTGGTYATEADADGKLVYMNTYLTGINLAENYDGGASDTRPKYAFGNANTYAGRQNDEWISLDGSVNTPNKFNMANRNLYGLTLGLVSGLDENGNLIWTTVYDEGEIVPELSINGLDIFSDTELTGKTAVEGSSLQFLRDGDTYTLFGVTGTQASVTDLDRFFNPESVASFRPSSSSNTLYHWVVYDGGTYDGATVPRIFTNNFWPLDTVPWYGTIGHDAKYGDAVWALNSYTSGHGYRGERGTTTTGSLVNGRRFFGDPSLTFPNSANTSGYARAMPTADDGVNHNTLFAMRYEVKFNLDESYCGPLEYLFFGDDDMWVFLDDTLVCDIGGVHSSVGEYVNLWDYLTPTRGDDSVYGEHTLTFFYTERGHSGSSCYMMFTLPEVTTQIPPPEHTDLVIKKFVTGTADKDTEKEFKVNVTLTDEHDQALLDDCFYTRYNADGVSVETGTISNGTAVLNIRADETIIISNLLVGTKYTVTENDYSADGYVTTVDAGIGVISLDALSVVEITNKRDAFGDLEIEKILEGNDVDPLKDFVFTITLSDNTLSGTYSDVEFVNGEATVSLKGGQSVVIEDLPNGLTYVITENDYSTDGYTLTVKTGDTGRISETAVAKASFTNTRNTYGDLEVKKTVNGYTGDRKFEFTVTLSDNTINGTYGDMTFANGVATFELAGGETAVATGLPNGITYTVVEEDYSDVGFTTTSTGADGTITGNSRSVAEFINDYSVTPVEVVLSGHKTLTGWPADKTPEPVFTFTLSDASGVIDTATVTKSGPFSFKAIEYDEPGVYTYTVKETVGDTSGIVYATTEYEVIVTVTDNLNGKLVYAISGDTTTGTDLDFLNTYETVDVTVRKVWDDENDKDGIRPLKIVVTLSNGTQVTLDAAHNWQATVTGLPKYETGTNVEIVYTWTEAVVPFGYELTGNVTDGYITTITNKHVPEYVDVSGVKIWDDANDEDGIRPSKVTVILYADGTQKDTTTATVGTNWAWAFSDLPK